MEFKVKIHHPSTADVEHVVEAAFPSAAVKMVAEALRMRDDWSATCTDEDNAVTNWIVSHQDLYYVRPKE